MLNQDSINCKWLLFPYPTRGWGNILYCQQYLAFRFNLVFKFFLIKNYEGEKILFYFGRVPNYMTAAWYLQANGNGTQGFKFSHKVIRFEEL